jgi:TolA-binding protein
MMQMSEETTTSRMSVPPSERTDSISSQTGEMAQLRKEVIEARNLIIKTDNLLKNLHAELKLMGRQHDEQEKRHWMTSVTAYVAFAVLAGVGAIAYARAEVRTARDEAQANEARAAALQKDGEKIRAADASRREAGEKALRVYDLLGSEKEGPGLNQAMQQALRSDRALLSPLESKAIDDRAAGLKVKMAAGALDRGQRAFRQQDWHTASQELGRYVEMEPKEAEPIVWFHLGNARVQTKDYQTAIVPLENFIKSAGGSKTAQYAGLLLGQSYEETGNAQKARDTYERALNLYPGSEFAPMIRNRLKRVQSQLSATGPAAMPKPQ